MSESANPTKSLDDRRRHLMAECGLDAYYQPASVWLSLAIAAETRGELTLQRDYERAMDLLHHPCRPRRPPRSIKAMTHEDEKFLAEREAKLFGWAHSFTVNPADQRRLISLARSPSQTARVKDPDQYMKVHDAAIAAYEASIPADYRYSATALRRAVDAAFAAAALVDAPIPQEPVAWMMEWPDGSYAFSLMDPTDTAVSAKVSPLYAAPPAPIQGNEGVTVDVETIIDAVSEAARYAPKVVPMGANPPLFDGMQPDNYGPWVSRVEVAKLLRKALTVASNPHGEK